MTGNILREKVAEQFANKQEMNRTIENLIHMAPENRNHKQMANMMRVVKQMQFF